MTELDFSTQLVGARDGISQLQRHWRPVDQEALSSVLLVHGMGEHSGRYDHVGRHLASQGHDVLAFDLRGHGQSGGPRGHIDSFTQFLDDVEDLVVERRQLGLPVVIVAHSLGGLIVSHYLVRGRTNPDLLVLSAPALGADPPRWQRVGAPILNLVAPGKTVPLKIRAERLTHDVRQQQAYVDDPLRLDGVTGRFGHEVFSAIRSTSAAIDRITVPTYVLHGDSDEVVPIKYTRPLAALPNVEYRTWAGLRHECFNEIGQEAVIGEMAAWIQQMVAANSSNTPT